jgi:hypothetical protein
VHALPDEPADDAVWQSADDVGEFSQGSPFSRWALSRYLVGRAIGESVGYTLLMVALLVFAVAAVSQWVLHVTLLAVLLAIFGLGVLLIRAVLRFVLRRLTEVDRYGSLESRLRDLVSDTRGDVLRELRRIGLPSHTVTLPLLGFRLVGKRRKATFERLREFDVRRAVPKSRLDELHMLLGGR